MGGSESFEDKRAHFSAKLCAYHARKGHKHSPHYLTINRDNLLKNSLHALKYLSEADWAKLFVIHFEGKLFKSLKNLYLGQFVVSSQKSNF